jgi:hypothetical protein
MKTQAAEVAAGQAGTTMTIGGGSMAVYGGLTSQELIALAGLMVAIAGYLLGWYYKRKADRRGQIYHEARMRALERGKAPHTGHGLDALDP